MCINNASTQGSFIELNPGSGVVRNSDPASKFPSPAPSGLLFGRAPPPVMNPTKSVTSTMVGEDIPGLEKILDIESDDSDGCLTLEGHRGKGKEAHRRNLDRIRSLLAQKGLNKRNRSLRKRLEVQWKHKARKDSKAKENAISIGPKTGEEIH
ncbi:hypothetical protein FRC11_006536 [Ceratobasidium sp. 423]|nr:hypothetical protein FRC11_006536 [Ceratobasidium sp. 423]